MTNPVAVTSARSVKPLYLLAGASGLLLYASFFPLNLGFLAWFALVPFFFLICSDARPRHVYRAAFFGGLAFYLPAIQWMRVAHPAMYGTWIALSVYSSIYFPLALWIVRKLDRARFPLSISMPAIWVSFEYMRVHFPTGFSWLKPTGIQHHIGFGWYFLGYSQHDFLPMVQIADIAGVYGVSLLVVLVNTMLYLWLSRLQRVRSFLFRLKPGEFAEAGASNSLGAYAPGSPVYNASNSPGAYAPGSPCCIRPWIGTVVTIGLLISTLAYGFSRLDHPPFETGPRVALLQSNLSQSVKMDHSNQLVIHMAGLLKQSIAVAPQEAPDLTIWPETTCDEDWIDVAPGVDRHIAPVAWQKGMAGSEQFARLISGWKSNQLIGLNGMEWESDGKIWKYNSALFVDRNGHGGLRYDKMHLVPFGEYVPLRNIFPWLKHFSPYKNDYSCKPGEHFTRFPLQVGDKTYQFGCLICYEDSDPSLARNYVLPSPAGPAVDFLTNISNDGWFDGTEEHEEHFAICRFRAIECRRSIVRAVNMGISGIIDGDGRIVKIPGNTWSESKKVATVINGLVPLDRRESLYALLGDWLPLCCWATTIIGLIVAFCRRRKISP